jgi:hypothetical protein
MVVFATISTPAYAQLKGGVRAGVSGGPTQFIFGGHVETKEIVDHLTFRPSVDFGVGNGGQIVGLNIEFAYYLPAKTDPWKFYLGAGPAANIVHASGFGTDLLGGFNLLAGVQHESGLFVEMKGGLADSPNFKFLVGYQLKSKK